MTVPPGKEKLEILISDIPYEKMFTCKNQFTKITARCSVFAKRNNR
jgi:hypothetical protein